MMEGVGGGVGGVGGYIDPELMKPVKELKEKWKLLPAFLQVRVAAIRRRRLPFPRARLAEQQEQPRLSLLSTHHSAHCCLFRFAHPPPLRSPPTRRAAS